MKVLRWIREHPGETIVTIFVVAIVFAKIIVMIWW